MLYDKEDPTKNAFTGTAVMNCAGSSGISISGSGSVASPWTFAVPNLGSGNNSCAIVTMSKTTVVFPDPNPGIFTILISKGYNIGDGACASTSANRIEREVKLEY